MERQKGNEIKKTNEKQRNKREEALEAWSSIDHSPLTISIRINRA
jgi:hypothetical protein